MRPASLAADSAYGSAESLAWLVKHKGIVPHIPVFDKSNPEPVGVLPGPISSLTPRATHLPVRRAKNWFSSDEPTPFPEAASQPRAQDSIAPANWIAMPANSKPSAVRTRSPARSRETLMKTPATWPVRTPQLRNTWRPVAVERKSRCYAHLKRILRLARLRLRGPNGAKDEFLLAATAQNLRRLARLRPINRLPEMLAA